MAIVRRTQMVLYSSPFGTPVWLIPEVAERRLIADLAWFNRARNASELTQRQLQHGPPRIDSEAAR